MMLKIIYIYIYEKKINIFLIKKYYCKNILQFITKHIVMQSLIERLLFHTHEYMIKQLRWLLCK